MQRAEAAGIACAAQLLARAWLSYIADVQSEYHQQGRVILIGTHLDKAASAIPSTYHADLKCLQRLCSLLKTEFQGSVTLHPQPLFIDTLDLSTSRSTVWHEVDIAASSMLHGQVVPKFINNCSDWMERHAADVSSQKWTTREEFKSMTLFKDLKPDQVASAMASLRKLGYIIELPSDHIVLKPSWFAAAASITLSPPPCPREQLTNSVHIHTDPARPGYIMLRALCDRLQEISSWTEFNWSADPCLASKEAHAVVTFLYEIGVVLIDPTDALVCTSAHKRSLSAIQMLCVPDALTDVIQICRARSTCSSSFNHLMHIRAFDVCFQFCW